MHSLVSLQWSRPSLRPVNASSKNLAINETMVGFRGHFGAKQYAPKNHSQMGHQGVQHGWFLEWVSSWHPCVQHKLLTHLRKPRIRVTSSARWVVMHLMRHYLNSNHHVCTDQYYTGIPLTQSLAPHNTSFTGTVMKNRFFQTWSEQNCSHSSRGVSDCWSQHGETKERIRPS